MDSLYGAYYRLLDNTKVTFKRYLYHRINWDNRLIIIRGAKGIGKTTLMLQRIKEAYPDKDKAFYASLDNLWFGSHTILSLVDYLYKHGAEVLFLDEVHKYPNWKQEVKNAYDSYPGFKVVISGSSMLELTSSAIGDLSRRARLYTMRGLSLREYLEYDAGISIEPHPLDQILEHHKELAEEITGKVKILPEFERYLRHGYYPFYKEEGDGFEERITRVVEAVIESEIPAFGNITYSSVYKLRKLLSILAENTPYSLNATALAKALETSRDNIIKLVSLLAKAALTINIYTDDHFKALAKPTKILFDNTNLMYSLSTGIDEGTLRETFVASQIVEGHSLIQPQKGDFKVDGRYVMEVGGKKKSYNQIKDMPDSYVVADDMEIGFGNKVPIWLLGFLY